jgi:inner membrane transporter RhtA
VVGEEENALGIAVGVADAKTMSERAPHQGGDSRSQRFAAGLVIGSTVSVQAGAALATTLFDELGPEGAVLLRTLSAALVLVALWRPHVRTLDPAGRRLAVLFGISLAGMNLCFYEALDRLPLGVAVTFEFTGPLAVALAGSRRALDFLWAALAALGIALLSGGWGAASPDALGVAFGIGAGAFWAAYILLGARVGRAFPGGSGLAIAMVVSALLLLPFGVAGGGGDLVVPALLATGVAVGLLSSVLPYSLELEALRRLPEGVFGVLMSLEPAVAALIGLLALGQDLALVELLAIGCVVVASAGALRGAATPAPLDA